VRAKRAPVNPSKRAKRTSFRSSLGRRRGLVVRATKFEPSFYSECAQLCLNQDSLDSPSPSRCRFFFVFFGVGFSWLVLGFWVGCSAGTCPMLLLDSVPPIRATGCQQPKSMDLGARSGGGTNRLACSLLLRCKAIFSFAARPFD